MANGYSLRFYMHENARHKGILLYDWLLDQAKKHGLHGGSAFLADMQHLIEHAPRSAKDERVVLAARECCVALKARIEANRLRNERCAEEARELLRGGDTTNRQPPSSEPGA